MLCQVHRCCTNQAPPYLCSKFSVNSNLSAVRTRGSDKLHLPQPRTSFFHSSFEFQGAIWYNKLPKDIRDLTRSTLFKSALLKYNCTNLLFFVYYYFLFYFPCCCLESLTALLFVLLLLLFLVCSFGFFLFFLVLFVHLQDLYENLLWVVDIALLLQNKVLSIYLSKKITIN